MKRLTAYDVLVGILHDFPAGKNEFAYDEESIIDFLSGNKENYSLLANFNRTQIQDGLRVLTAAWMLYGLSSSSGMRKFSPSVISYNFRRNNQPKFSEKALAEVRDLSRKFVDEFG